MVVRLVQIDGDPELSIPDYVTRLQRNFVYATFRVPAHEHGRRMPPGPSMWYLDATGDGPPGVAFMPYLHYVQSPAQLEQIAIVLARLRNTIPGALAVFDDLGTLAKFSGDEAAVQFVAAICDRTRADGDDLDLLYLDDAKGHQLATLLRHLADECLVSGEAYA